MILLRSVLGVLLCLALLSAPGRAAGLLPNGLRTEGDPESKWYLERNPAAARADAVEAAELEGVPSVIVDLEGLLRDGGVPGFYDGQFAVTADRFDELLAVALDPDLHHVMRTMAIMALQEADRGPRLVEALDALLIPARVEYQVEYSSALRALSGTVLGVGEDHIVRRELEIDLSRHARFALAKAGHPQAILERIEVLEEKIEPFRDLILDPAAPQWDFRVYFHRSLWFSIAYHYQQFDDYENASIWFRALTENLRGGDARWAHYNLACLNALQGRPEEAVIELAGAIEDGFSDLAWMDEDGDLSSLRGRADFQRLRTELGAKSEISDTSAVESSPEPSAPNSP